jgi:CubicO group peptidase (beta-lactamase class C family)
MRLVDDGVLDLDADIADYLTSWQLPASDDG